MSRGQRSGTILGINYPWYNYGFDFAPAVTNVGQPQKDELPDYQTRWDSPLPSDIKIPTDIPSGTNNLKTQLDYDLAVFSAAGIQIVRWFILGDMWSIGSPKLSNGKWSYALPKTIPKCMGTSFTQMLQSFQSAGMQVMPVLTNYSLFCGGRVLLTPDSALGGEVAVPTTASSVDQFVQQQLAANPHLRNSASSMIDWNQWVKGGKSAILYDPSVQAQFMEDIFGALLKAAKGYERQIFAWDICNEPNVAFNPGGDNLADPQTTPQVLGAFLAAAVKKAVLAGYSATVGFLNSDGSSQFDAVRGGFNLAATQSMYGAKYFSQFHFYPETNPGGLSTPKGPPRQAIIGEFSTDFPKTGSSSWPNTLGGRLNQIQQQGYGYAFPWAYRRTIHALWTADCWSDARQFTQTN